MEGDGHNPLGKNELPPHIYQYLGEHRIEQLFANAMAGLVDKRPADPKKYLADFMRQVKSARDEVRPELAPRIGTDADLLSMFEAFDVTSKGFLTGQQYEAAMKNLGISVFDEQPYGFVNGKIMRETFLEEARAGQIATAAAYSAFQKK